MTYYFVICSSEDGETRVDQYSHDDLLSCFEAGGYEGVTFLDRVPFPANPLYWEGEYTCVIVRGDVVKPTPVEIIKTWEIQ